MESSRTKRTVGDSLVYKTSNITGTHYRIYMIPGNPGLISFYDDFLQGLRDRLQTVPGSSFTLHGSTLGGFETESNAPTRSPLGLNAQSKHVYSQIFGVSKKAPVKEKVILMGHSVGSFFLLETLRQYNELKRERELPYEIIGGLCLFPTVCDIGKSPSGIKVGWLANLPHFAIIIGLVARFLVAVFPLWILEWLVGVFTGFPKHGVDSIVAFLNSRMGVRQALHMAKDEINEITTDRWDAEVWGAAGPKSARTPKLYFFFGRNDHWVAEETREQLINFKGHVDGNPNDGKPKMEVDETGLPHAFCIEHSEQVADICAGYIREIVSGN